MKNSSAYKYSLAVSTWGEEEKIAMRQVIEEDSYTMGKRVKQYEKMYSEYLDSKYSVMVNSGSSANLLMIASLFFTENPKYKLKKDDEVIVPAVSWGTTYFPLQQYGLKVKFVDIDLKTLNINLEQLKTAVTNKTRAILLVNLLGNPNNFKEIEKIIKGREIIILEDNCESLGAKFSNKLTGTFGLMGTFSSFFSHHISTMEGGLITTNDREIYEILLSLRAHGWTRDLNKNNLLTAPKDNKFDDNYNFILPGYNLRPLEIEAAAGIEQLKKLDKMIIARRKNAEIFKNALKKQTKLLIQNEIGESSWFGFSLIIDPNYGKNRRELTEALDDIGIEYRPIVAGNFLNKDAVKFFNYEVHEQLINAEYIDKNGLFIGNSHFDLSEMISALSKINF